MSNQMVRAKAIMMALITAALMLGLTGCQVTATGNNVTHRLSRGVNSSTTDEILNSLDEAEKVISKGEVFTLVITSPGGSVPAYTTVLDRFSRTPLRVRTKVHTHAASVGAMMFLMGDERVMAKDATILFHNARYIPNGVHITATMLKRYIAKDKTLKKHEREAIKSMGDYSVIQVLLDDLNEINANLFKTVASRVGAKLAKKLLIDGWDVILNGEQALKLGVATKVYTMAVTRVGPFKSGRKHP